MHHQVRPTSSSCVNSCTPLNCYTAHRALPRRPSPYASLNVEQMNEKIVRCAFIFPWFVACICERQLTAFSTGVEVFDGRFLGAYLTTRIAKKKKNWVRTRFSENAVKYVFTYSMF